MGEDGNPPDLRYSRDLCESVKHNDQFQFTSARERSRLVNVLTGECHWFQADSAFEISASGWGYIVSSFEDALQYLAQGLQRWLGGGT